MNKGKFTVMAGLFAGIMGLASASNAAEQCNTYTSNVCFGIDWTKATLNDLGSINPEIYDANGRTILHWAAARSNSAELIIGLIKEGFPVNLKDGADATPLHVAVEGSKSSKAVVKALLAAGADIHAVAMNDSVLHMAARNGEPWLIKMLLGAGANPNALDFDNFTPLYSAVFNNPNPEVTSMLINAGADVNHVAKSEDRAQQAAYRPLHAAAKGTRNPEIIRILVKAGAVVEQPNRNGYTPLHVAGDANRTPEVIKAFAEVGADFNARSKDGHTPLHLAAYTNYPEMLEAFIDAGSDVNMRDNNEQTPLHFATIGNGDPAVVTTLIQAGVDPVAKDSSGRTPFSYAKKNDEMRGTDGDGYRLLQSYSE